VAQSPNSSRFTLRAQSVSPHHEGVAHQTSLRSRRTMMTRANSLHAREAGSLRRLDECLAEEDNGDRVSPSRLDQNSGLTSRVCGAGLQPSAWRRL
jgi:hypothetical protein